MNGLKLPQLPKGVTWLTPSYEASGDRLRYRNRIRRSKNYQFYLTPSWFKEILEEKSINNYSTYLTINYLFAISHPDINDEEVFYSDPEFQPLIENEEIIRYINPKYYDPRLKKDLLIMILF